MSQTRSGGRWSIVIALMAATSSIGACGTTTTPTTVESLAPTTIAVASTSSRQGGTVTSTSTPENEPAAPQAPVEFSGRIVCGGPVRGAPTERFDLGDGIAVRRFRGGAWRQTVTMSDPRLEGTVYYTWEGDEYRLGEAEAAPVVWAATRRIENEQGAWVSLDIGGTFADGTNIGDPSPVYYVGEGAYAGLVAITQEVPLEGECGVEVRGIIFDGAPIPQPFIPVGG